MKLFIDYSALFADKNIILKLVFVQFRFSREENVNAYGQIFANDNYVGIYFNVSRFSSK